MRKRKLVSQPFIRLVTRHAQGPEKEVFLFHLCFNVVQYNFSSFIVIANAISYGHKIYRGNHVAAMNGLVFIAPIIITSLFFVPKTTVFGTKKRDEIGRAHV